MDGFREETIDLLRRYQITANKKLGQNFLVNETVVEEILQTAKISQKDLVIEIGPGLGTLTSKLLERSGKVLAIELDDRMIRILQDRFGARGNFELLHADILKVPLAEKIQEEKANRKVYTCKNCSKFAILYYNTNYYEIIRRAIRD